MTLRQKRLYESHRALTTKKSLKAGTSSTGAGTGSLMRAKDFARRVLKILADVWTAMTNAVSAKD